MKYRNTLMAAITLGTLGAGASTVYLSDGEAVARSPAFSLQAPREDSRTLSLAMNADEGVPQNLVTRTR
jgi:hypothetical protein